MDRGPAAEGKLEKRQISLTPLRGFIMKGKTYDLRGCASWGHAGYRADKGGKSKG